MVIPRLEGASRHDVDADAQEILKILEQADVIDERCTWLEVHEQVKIAVWASPSPWLQSRTLRSDAFRATPRISARRPRNASRVSTSDRSRVKRTGARPGRSVVGLR